MKLGSLRYARLRLFEGILRTAGSWARQRRMAAFLQRMCPTPATRILDLGGRPPIWESVTDRTLDITILNLPGETGKELPSRHRVTYVEGDACDVHQFGAGSFDLVFSNSVVEHVGDDAHQEAFAAAVRRLAPSYWVQTPSRWFPLEAHTGMPFWWQTPEVVRAAIQRRWEQKLPAWSRMIAGTRVLSRERLQELFPDARLFVESAAGIPKSYAVFRVAAAA